MGYRISKGILYFILIFSIPLTTYSASLPLQQLQLPPGFTITVYAKAPNARQLALGAQGVVFVGTRTADKVYALIPNADHTQAKRVITVASGLNIPNGVAYRDGALYVAEPGRILRYAAIATRLDNPPQPTVIYDQLLDNPHHGARYLGFGPDDWLYVAVGAPCNSCLSLEPYAGTILRLKPDGTKTQVFAKGIRNSVGFDWDPLTQRLWFTDNGRDWLGDNSPPDELNYAPRPGMDFGFPFYYGKNVPDPKYSKRRSPQSFTPPVLELPAHVAALGMVFYTGTLFPKAYRNQIFIAEHGSWNRSHKVGYQVIAVQRQGNRVLTTQPFITGWLQGEHDWGRPVDLLVMPDGALLVSDDKAGTVYRVSYQSPVASK